MSDDDPRPGEARHHHRKASRSSVGAMVVTVSDTRTVETQYGGTIPGSVNIAYDVIADRLDELGCTRATSGWRCENALNTVLYCNGPNCGQSPRAMAAMVEAGFPASKLSYYRGGMLAWTSLGLTTRENMHLK